MSDYSGTDATREFYDRQGWTVQDGTTIDRRLFWAKEDGPIRSGLHSLHWQRVRSHLGQDLDLLEVGCGGNPESMLWPICRRYTGCDFSVTGIELAKKTTESVSVPCTFHVADACDLPFEDEEFEALYCAHMIYHIADRESQAAAIREMVRVVRPGGRIALIAANPRPLAFPGRLSRRLLADSPAGPILDRLRKKKTLPYNPRPVNWMVEQFRRAGAADVRAEVWAMPSTEFSQRFSEYRGMGWLLWRTIDNLDRHHPGLARSLGCYVTFAVTK